MALTPAEQLAARPPAEWGDPGPGLSWLRTKRGKWLKVKVPAGSRGSVGTLSDPPPPVPPPGLFGGLAPGLDEAFYDPGAGGTAGEVQHYGGPTAPPPAPAPRRAKKAKKKTTVSQPAGGGGGTGGTGGGTGGGTTRTTRRTTTRKPAPTPRTSGGAPRPGTIEAIMAPAEEREEARSFLSAAAPAFAPLIGQPEPYRAPSWGDVMIDPRFRAAAEDAEERTRAQAAAAGVTGAPLLSALSSGRRGLLTAMHDALQQEDLRTWDAARTHGRETYDRMAGDWQRRYDPATRALDYGLRAPALSHGQYTSEQDLEMRRQQQEWAQWWAEEQQRRAQAHASGMADQSWRRGLFSGLVNDPYPTIAAPW